MTARTFTHATPPLCGSTRVATAAAAAAATAAAATATYASVYCTFTAQQEQQLVAACEALGVEAARAALAAASLPQNNNASPATCAAIPASLRDIRYACTAGRNCVFHIAVIKRSLELLNVLYEGGPVDFVLYNLRNADGNTALHLAVMAGSTAGLPLAKLLIEKGADVNIKNNNGDTPLHIAVSFGKGHHDLVVYLLERGANVKARNISDKTALHIASSAAVPAVETVNLLLKKGAQTNAKDIDGKQPLEYAIQIGHQGVCHALRLTGADVGLFYQKRDSGLPSPSPTTTPSAATSSSGASSAITVAAPAEAEASEGADSFGFLKSPDETPQQKRNTAARDALRQVKWSVMVKEWEKTMKKHPNKIRRRVYKGVPDCVRGDVWQRLTGSLEKKKELSDVHYQDLLLESNKCLEQIDLDINRAFRNHIMFKDRFGQGQIALFNVLKAYSNYDKETGYCQGMCELAGFLLIYMGEEEAFWVFLQLLNDPRYNFRGMFLPGFPLLHQCFYCHDQLLAECVPKVAKNFQALEINTSFYATKWYMTLFLDVIPVDILIRLWDILFLEDSRILFTFGIQLMRILERDLANGTFERAMAAFKQLENLPLDPDKFVAAIMKHIIPSTKIDKLIAQYQATNPTSN